MTVDLKKVLKAQGFFSMYMFTQSQTLHGNIMFCPLAITGFLAWLYDGAGGNNRDLFSKILYLAESETAVKGIANMIGVIEELPVYFQNFINVYLGSEFTLQPRVKQFAELLKIHVETIPSDSASLAHINNTLNTMNKGGEGEPSASKPIEYVRRGDQLVVINTVYMRAPWASKFTLLEGLSEFTTSKGKKLQVQMMTNTLYCHLRTDDELEADIVMIPLITNKLSIIIINPDEKADIEEIVYKFTDYGMETVFSNFTSGYLKVTLPKFKLEVTTDFKRIEEFASLYSQSRCNLSLLVEEATPPVMNKMIHRMCLEVDEEGDSSPSTTSKEVVVDGEIIVNRSFVVCLYVHETVKPYGLIYGKVLNPLA